MVKKIKIGYAQSNWKKIFVGKKPCMPSIHKRKSENWSSKIKITIEDVDA